MPLGVFGSGPAYAADTVPADGGARLPDTDRAKVVRAYRTGGRSVRTAAVAALVGNADEVATFLGERLPAAVAEDNRFTLTQALVSAGRATRTGIGEALTGGNAAVAAYQPGQGGLPAHGEYFGYAVR
ncbi:ALF repeat-containing protein [Streptomyces althioticus]|uniref:ALF repeat-containing protein n=1 Tax=Streptomyces TaxID=1883 RepID=UPI0036F87690